MISSRSESLVGSIPRAQRAGISVLIATDLRVYQDHLAESLRVLGLEVSATAADPAAALEAVGSQQPDVLLLDMSMPGAAELAGALRDTLPALRTVALAIPPNDRIVLSCARAGVIGYVLRNASLEDIAGIIRSAASGEMRCPPVIAEILRQHLADTEQLERDRVAASALTRREREIVPLLDQGLDNKAIARTLGIEVATVKNHIHNILEKLQVHRRGEAAARLNGRAEGGVPLNR